MGWWFIVVLFLDILLWYLCIVRIDIGWSSKSFWIFEIESCRVEGGSMISDIIL